MNILIGKIGRSVFFNEASWNMYAGDEEAPILYTLLAKTYPEHTFYFIGRSDLSRYKRKISIAEASSFSSFFEEDDNQINQSDDFNNDIPDNIVDLFENYNKSKDGYAHEYLEKQISEKKLKFDIGIIFQGPSFGTSLPNAIYKIDDNNTYTAPLEMGVSYSAPIIHALNITNVPYFLLVSDPRYVPILQRDVINDERFILSQINTKFSNRKRICGYYEESKKFRMVDLDYRYAGIETIFMINKKKVDFTKFEKTNNFIIALNSAGIKSERQQIITDWLLKDNNNSIKIYGKWENEFIEKYPGVFEETAIRDLEDKFFNSRFTFIPPFSKKHSKFVTQKFWKMIYYGVIPFFHPYYDTEKLFKVPDILRVSTPKDMWKRIEWLNNNESDYRKLLTYFYSMLDDSFFSGQFMINKINDSVKEILGKTL